MNFPTIEDALRAAADAKAANPTLAEQAREAADRPAGDAVPLLLALLVEAVERLTTAIERAKPAHEET